MALEMVHPDERKAGGERQPARVVRADEKAADEPGADRGGDGVDALEIDAGVAERLVGDGIDGPKVLARRDLGDDATGRLMRELRADHVRADAAAVLDHRHAGLVAARLDREDLHRSSSFRSTERRSRTTRSLRRSVHMMSASSLLSL